MKEVPADGSSWEARVADIAGSMSHTAKPGTTVVLVGFNDGSYERMTSEEVASMLTSPAPSVDIAEDKTDEVIAKTYANVERTLEIAKSKSQTAC